jgi:hypothetical protein
MKFQRSRGKENQRGFNRHCLGVGATLTAVPAGSSQGAGFGKNPSPHESTELDLSEYEPLCDCGLAHQYQRGGQVPVDCPLVDWWLLLFPGGIDWAFMTELPQGPRFACPLRASV